MEKRMEKTDYKITEFHNSEFGSIRMIEDGGRLLFSGIDVAFALGYAKPRNAINVHCKGALKRGVLTSGGVQPMIFIPEGDVYRLITKSRLKSAQNFEKWVFDEVLPAIRKTGGYLETDLLDRVKDNPGTYFAILDFDCFLPKVSRQIPKEVPGYLLPCLKDRSLNIRLFS